MEVLAGLEVDKGPGFGDARFVVGLAKAPVTVDVPISDPDAFLLEPNELVLPTDSDVFIDFAEKPVKPVFDGVPNGLGFG